MTPREATTFRRLQHQLRAIERRLHQSDQVVEQANSGTSIFDLSGAVITMNAAMYRLLHTCESLTTDMRLLSVIRCLTGRDTAECRELFRRIVFKHERERIPITHPSTGEFMVVVLQPVFRSDHLANDAEEIQAFDVQGIHVELFPGELLCGIYDVREHVAERTLAAVNETLDDILGLSSQILAIAAPSVATSRVECRPRHATQCNSANPCSPMGTQNRSTCCCRLKSM